MRRPRTFYPMALAAFSALGACGGAPIPCLGAGTCPSGTECLASRCVLEGSAPVAADSERVVLTPVELAIASGETATGVGPTVTLGNPSASASLYVRFPRAERARAIEAAFLLLEQSPGVIAGPDLELEVWRASSPWSGSGFSWSDQPGFSPPSARAIARSRPALPVRVDITSLVEFNAEHPNRDYGFAIRASDSKGAGVTLNTGLAGGVPPRLDVYFAAERARAKNTAQ